MEPLPNIQKKIICRTNIGKRLHRRKLPPSSAHLPRVENPFFVMLFLAAIAVFKI